MVNKLLGYKCGGNIITFMVCHVAGWLMYKWVG